MLRLALLSTRENPLRLQSVPRETALTRIENPMQLHVAGNQTMVHSREQVHIMIVMVFFRSRVSPPGWTTATPPVEKTQNSRTNSVCEPPLCPLGLIHKDQANWSPIRAPLCACSGSSGTKGGIPSWQGRSAVRSSSKRAPAARAT